LTGWKPIPHKPYTEHQTMPSIAILPGDGIGPEVTDQALRVIEKLNEMFDVQFTTESQPVGGAAYEMHGHPLPESTLSLAKSSDAVLLGAVGGPQWEAIDRQLRPEKALLGLRSEMDLFSNLRPAMLFPELADASTLKPEVVSGLDIMIVRELTGGIYFGGPRAIEGEAGSRKGFNTMVYTEPEIERIARSAFDMAMRRDKRLCSVDKANVLEVSELWREVVTEAIGMLPSASLDSNGKGMYEPVHGSAPDIAGQGKANPLATILSVAMMMRSTFGNEQCAAAIESAVKKTLADGIRTGDIAAEGEAVASTEEMGSAVVERM